MKNVYDLEGNYFEWTSEANGTYGRVGRGGNFNDAYNGKFYPASVRGDNVPTGTNSNYSARLTLYL